MNNWVSNLVSVLLWTIISDQIMGIFGQDYYSLPFNDKRNGAVSCMFDIILFHKVNPELLEAEKAFRFNSSFGEYVYGSDDFLDRLNIVFPDSVRDEYTRACDRARGIVEEIDPVPTHCSQGSSMASIWFQNLLSCRPDTNACRNMDMSEMNYALYERIVPSNLGVSEPGMFDYGNEFFCASSGSSVPFKAALLAVGLVFSLFLA